MEELQMCNATCCKMESLRLVVAFVVRPYTLPRQVKNSTCGVVKSEGKESECVASAIPLGVDAVAMCRGVTELVGKRKAANDYLYTSLGELKRAWGCRRCIFRLRLCLRGQWQRGGRGGECNVTKIFCGLTTSISGSRPHSPRAPRHISRRAIQKSRSAPTDGRSFRSRGARLPARNTSGSCLLKRSAIFLPLDQTKYCPARSRDARCLARACELPGWQIAR